MSDQPFGTLKNVRGERLDYACEGGAAPGDGLLVVIAHGVTANKDRDWARTLAAELAGAGFASLRFSFSGNGESEGDFRESTISKEVQDLGAVLDAVGRRPLGVIGHSMGGAVGVLRAADDPRVSLLVSLAGMVHTWDFYRRKFGELTPGQDVMWDKPECPLSQAFKDDLERIDSVLPRAKDVGVPWFLVHGTEDTVVPCAESREAAAAGPHTQLLEVPGADHLFSGDNERVMAQAVVRWLQSQA